MRAICERTAVEPCRASFGGMADYDSAMPILSVGVRWGRAIDWVCKPEVAGSIPARSTPARSPLRLAPQHDDFDRFVFSESASGPTPAKPASGDLSTEFHGVDTFPA